MILSLITLCVVMLFMEDRISRFLHGGSEPAGEEQDFLAGMAFFSDWGDALAGFWRDCSDFLASASGAVTDKPDNEKVVITEDTIQQVWVWRQDGAIQSARQEPSNADARQVMIPADMTAAEFFGEPATGDAADRTAEQSQTSAPATKNDPANQGRADTETPLDQFSPEQRRAMLKQGMEVLHQQSGNPGGRNPR